MWAAGDVGPPTPPAEQVRTCKDRFIKLIIQSLFKHAKRAIFATVSDVVGACCVTSLSYGFFVIHRDEDVSLRGLKERFNLLKITSFYLYWNGNSVVPFVRHAVNSSPY